MTYKTWWYLIASDVYRYDGRIGVPAVVRELFLGTGSKYAIWMRTVKYLSLKGGLWLPLALLARLRLRHLGIKYGIEISWKADIGPGFYIGHHGGIVVGPGVIIGRNCNVSQGVTIGVANRGRVGAPRIGDCVYIGPGAKLYGKIRVGDHAAIGANAVVSQHVKTYSVVTPGPMSVIHSTGSLEGFRGSEGYINYADYDQHCAHALAEGCSDALTPEAAGGQESQTR